MPSSCIGHVVSYDAAPRYEEALLYHRYHRNEMVSLALQRGEFRKDGMSGICL